MKTRLLCFAAMAVVICAPSAHASLILQLTPPVISGAPGTEIGWGFSLTSDSAAYYSVTAALLLNETNSSLGSFFDWISSQGGPINGVLAPSSTWTQSYDLSQGSGIGQYVIDSMSAPGSSDSGELLITYDSFSADPNNCGSCYVGSDSVGVPFEVDVIAATPEPGSAALFALGLAAVLGLRRSATKRKSEYLTDSFLGCVR